MAVKIGVIGVGSFGAMHARTLAGLAEAELVGVVDSNPAAIESLRKDVPGVRAWDNFDAALAESGAQAWIVATRTDTHVPLAEKILGRGLSALVEKPLGPDVPTARRLEKLVRADSSDLMLGHIVLFASKYRLLMAEAKKRGPIKYFHAFRHRPAWMNQKFAEETPLRFTMVHDLYMALALMDAQEPTRLSARMRRRADGSGFDLATAEIEWPSGTWGSFTASFLTPDGMPEDGFDRFEIFGEGWAARLELNPQPLQVFTNRVSWPMGLEIDDNPIAPSGMMAEELRHFCRVVAGKATVPVGARYQDGVQVQSWMDKLDASARSRA